MLENKTVSEENSYNCLSSPVGVTYLKAGRLDALADLIPNVDVSRLHFGQNIGPNGWLLPLWPSPVEVWWSVVYLLQLQAPAISSCTSRTTRSALHLVTGAHGGVLTALLRATATRSSLYSGSERR